MYYLLITLLNIFLIYNNWNDALSGDISSLIVIILSSATIGGFIIILLNKGITIKIGKD